MEALTGIVQALGINSTLFVQLGLFLVVLLFLWGVVFNPYFAAFNERQSQTLGNQDEAESLAAKTRELEAIYQRKARGANMDIKSIFDKQRLSAQEEHERILLEAKDRSRNLIDSAKTQVQEEYNRAREELLKESGNFGREIADRLVAKEN